MLSMQSEEQYARRTFRAGASGYIMKNSSLTAFVAAINKLRHGGAIRQSGTGRTIG
jgi:DNA-binding NarL/FixJ family response regulator